MGNFSEGYQIFRLHFLGFYHSQPQLQCETTITNSMSGYGFEFMYLTLNS